MADIVSYQLADGVATIRMDDGQNNLISPRMISELNGALDRAERDRAVVILTGRDNVLSAGFDLKTLRSGVLNAFSMLIGGFKLSRRLLSFPTPVIIACNGHAIAMGSFLVLSGDYRIGVKGEFKIVANEVAIGLTLPYSAITICRQRLKPASFEKATLLSELNSPEAAVEAGFLDEIVEISDLMTRALEKAESFRTLDLDAHFGSKKRSRKKMLRALDRAIWKDRISFVLLGIGRALKPRKKST